MALVRSMSCFLVTSALFCSSTLIAQTATPARRIVAPVDESALTTLRGHVPYLAKAIYDQGQASPSTQMTHIRLVLSRSAEQQAALDQYLVELQDKSSANYHKWLTPDRFGKLYGPADSDVAAIVAWLESHGLKLEGVSAGRSNVAFAGTVNQVEEAFHTSIHLFNVNGQQFYSNVSDPKIPAALSPVVKGVARLNTIAPRANYVRGRMGQYDPATGRLAPLPPSSSKVHSDFTYEDQNSNQYIYVVPADAATIYNTPNFLNVNYASGTSYTGAGVTIGIGGDSAITNSYFTSYRSFFIGDNAVPIVTNVDGIAENADNIVTLPSECVSLNVPVFEDI
jgi:subtilase family serine protease